MAKANGSTKWCPKCKQTIGIESFGSDKRRPDGLKVWCKACHNASSKASYDRDPSKKRAQNQRCLTNNPGYMRIYGAAYYQLNRERLDRINKSWFAAHPEVRRAQSLRDYYKHVDLRRAANRAWHAKNPEKAKAARQAWLSTPEGMASVKVGRVTYKARKRGALGSHTKGDIKAIFGAQRGRCAYCRQRLPKTGYHVDHITPVSKGGSNDRRNLQLTCARCNISKKDKDPIVFARYTGRLV